MNGNRGMLYAAGAYAIWGLLPIYWKALQSVPAGEVLAHRVVWAMLVTMVLIIVRRRSGRLLQALRSPRILLVFGASGLLLTVNWLVYIWAVQAGHVLESSLGYFINPLVNVLLGVLFLRERMRLGQGIAIILALAGVLYLTFTYGSLPWIALTLAGTFGIYGLIRKTAALGSLDGLALETLLLSVPALAYLIVVETNGGGAFGHSDTITTLLLICSGAVTSVPLVLFAAGARRITMITLGVLQYIAPSLQFLLGAFLYGEALNPQRLTGFGLIWLALAVYTFEGVRRSRTATARPATAGGAS